MLSFLESAVNTSPRVRMKILVTNDDGIHAPGLEILAAAMQSFGEVAVVAPDRDCSGASNCLTLANPLRITYQVDNRIGIAGTPTDCVYLALTGLLPTRPDIVVAGINPRPNLGDDVLYSGTVAAAIEGRFLGLPAIAISLGRTEEEEREDYKEYYETAARVAKLIVTQLQADPLPSQTILNVNIPNCEFKDLQGFEVCRLGKRYSVERVEKTMDPRGKPIYWLGLPAREEDGGPGTDFWALKNRKVAICPLQVDLTHYALFDKLSEWVKKISPEV